MLKNLQAKLKDQKGFSLVELIVVIAIMVILIAMLVPNVVGYINKSTVATEKSAVASIFTAAQAYATDCYGQNTPLTTGSNLASSILSDSTVALLGEDPSVKYGTVSIIINSTNPAIVDYVSFSSKTDSSKTVKYASGMATLS